MSVEFIGNHTVYDSRTRPSPHFSEVDINKVTYLLTYSLIIGVSLYSLGVGLDSSCASRRCHSHRQKTAAPPQWKKSDVSMTQSKLSNNYAISRKRSKPSTMGSFLRILITNIGLGNLIDGVGPLLLFCVSFTSETTERVLSHQPGPKGKCKRYDMIQESLADVTARARQYSLVRA